MGRSKSVGIRTDFGFTESRSETSDSSIFFESKRQISTLIIPNRKSDAGKTSTGRTSFDARSSLTSNVGKCLAWRTVYPKMMPSVSVRCNFLEGPPGKSTQINGCWGLPSLYTKSRGKSACSACSALTATHWADNKKALCRCCASVVKPPRTALARHGWVGLV